MQPFSFDEANSGDLIIVHCAVVKGDTPISLKWLFEGRHLEVGDGVGITALGDRVSALTIPAVRGEHAGEYACVADNPAGRARHSAHLKVNGTKKRDIMHVIHGIQQKSERTCGISETIGNRHDVVIQPYMTRSPLERRCYTFFRVTLRYAVIRAEKRNDVFLLSELIIRSCVIRSSSSSRVYIIYLKEN